MDGDSQFAAELSVYNWAEYIDEELITKYEEMYGVDVIYDTYASNEDLLAKLQAGAEGYDVIFPSDYMVDIMIGLELLAEIDTSQLSNFGNLDPQFLNPPFDPGNKHCVPYQWGTTGLGYRAGHPYFDETPPDSWAYLFEPDLLEKFADGGVNVLNDPRELPAAALLYLGYDPNTTNPDELNEARDLILRAKPFWKTFNSEDYANTLLIPDEVVFTHGWSGGVATAYWNTYSDETEDGNWYYVIPKEGAIKWLDNMCITASSTRHETALHFINYLLDAQNGAAITNFTYYGSPNKAAQEHIAAEILADPSIYPSAQVQAKLIWLTEVDEESTFLYDELWTAVKAQ
ncbi:spermidine/putrescine ABC transporter substrate-binding protein [Chloroflexi bacterium TSY]|nr:spermidine/putrescine ABC transporter substrate-binding protein [Chloroflexi bacterium TSY]